jgi:hypothetical protein
LKQTIEVTLKPVGPVTRTHFQKKGQDPIEESIGDILHWAWSTRLQIRRLTQSLQSEFQFLGARSFVVMKHSSNTSYDEHMVLVAAGNLHKALKRAPKAVRIETRLSMKWERALCLLRNIYEHWDKFRSEYRSGSPLTRAAQKLRSEFPGAEPWSFKIDPSSDDIVIANVVPLKPLWKELRFLEAHLLRLRRRRKKMRKSPIATHNPKVEGSNPSPRYQSNHKYLQQN